MNFAMLESFIFGRKKGDKNMHEQVSHGYQMWRDRLAQEIRGANPFLRRVIAGEEVARLMS